MRDLWAYSPEKCDGMPCPGDCDNCLRAMECPPRHDANECAADAEMCEVCWETFGGKDMTNEEAINVLSTAIWADGQNTDDITEAIYTAISALSRDRWISVEERLPEECEGLHFYEDTTIRFTSVWCCDTKTGSMAIRNRLQGKKTGNKYLDQALPDAEWHWSKLWWEPTHWTPFPPFPEPPKEET